MRSQPVPISHGIRTVELGEAGELESAFCVPCGVLRRGIFNSLYFFVSDSIMNSIEVFVLTGPFMALFQSAVSLEIFYTYLATRETENVPVFTEKMLLCLILMMFTNKFVDTNMFQLEDERVWFCQRSCTIPLTGKEYQIQDIYYV